MHANLRDLRQVLGRLGVKVFVQTWQAWYPSPNFPFRRRPTDQVPFTAEGDPKLHSAKARVRGRHSCTVPAKAAVYTKMGHSHLSF